MSKPTISAELAERMAEIETRNAQAKAEGVPALKRLADIAGGEHGQAHHLRRFLLGLYNSEQWPFELNRLRVLDPESQADALRVIALDWCGSEIHRYLDDGEARFRGFWQREQGE